MQAVQLDQLLPQTAAVQSLPQDYKTGDTSFMEALQESQGTLEKQLNTSESESAKKSTDTTEKTSVDSKDEKIASVKSSGEEKETEENVIPQELVNHQQAVERIVVSYSLNEQSPESDDLKTAPLSENQLKWLYKTANNSESAEEMSDEELAKLINAAEDFIPGELSQEELLEKAQNLSVKDPAKFLSEKEAAADFTVTNQFQTAGKDSKEKTASIKAEKKTVSFDITDLRTSKNSETSTEMPVTKVQNKKDFDISYKRESSNSFQVSMDLSAQAKQNITSSSDQSAAAQGSTFQNMLANAIQENAPDFVKAGSIVLKDNNQGNINLILHPDKLGNVKISLNLNEKVISGSITVQSQEAYEAMKDSIAALKNAFAGNGFETGEFNLNFNNGQQEFARQHQNQEQQKFQANYHAERSYGEFTAAAVDSDVNEQIYSNLSNYSVNIVA